MKIAILISTLTVVSGCATWSKDPRVEAIEESTKQLVIDRKLSEAKFTEKCDARLGKPVKELLATWGIPTKEYSIDKTTKLVEYTTSKTEESTSYGVYSKIEKTCKVTFTSTKGIVNDWKWEGNGCGRIIGT